MGKKNKQRPVETFDGQELHNQDDVMEQVRRSAAWFHSKYDYISSPAIFEEKNHIILGTMPYWDHRVYPRYKIVCA